MRLFLFPIVFNSFFTIPIRITCASFSLAFSISAVDSGDMQSISKFNKGRRSLLCIIGIFSKYVWVVPLKDKKGVNLVNAFQKILDDSKRKSNKKLVDLGSEFYNNSFKK